MAGIVFIEDVFEANVFMFFEQILAKCKVPKKDFWKYLQLRNRIMSTKRKISHISRTVIQDLFQGSQLVMGGASSFYSLIRLYNPPKLDSLRRA